MSCVPEKCSGNQTYLPIAAAIYMKASAVLGTLLNVKFIYCSLVIASRCIQLQRECLPAISHSGGGGPAGTAG